MSTIQDDEIIVFDMYYAGLMAMNLHPGTTRDPASRKNAYEVAEIALNMLDVRRSLLPPDPYVMANDCNWGGTD